LKRVVPSEILLLQREIADDNVAHNGEVYVTFGSSEDTSTGPCGTLTLEDRKSDMIIPWEVNPKCALLSEKELRKLVELVFAIKDNNYKSTRILSKKELCQRLGLTP